MCSRSASAFDARALLTGWPGLGPRPRTRGGAAPSALSGGQSPTGKRGEQFAVIGIGDSCQFLQGCQLAAQDLEPSLVELDQELFIRARQGGFHDHAVAKRRVAYPLAFCK